MAKQRIEVGDRLTIGADVTAVWPDGKITIYIPSAGQKVTLPSDSDVEEVSKGEKPGRRQSLFDKTE